MDRAGDGGEQAQEVKSKPGFAGEEILLLEGLKMMGDDRDL